MGAWRGGGGGRRPYPQSQQALGRIDPPHPRSRCSTMLGRGGGGGGARPSTPCAALVAAIICSEAGSDSHDPETSTAPADNAARPLSAGASGRGPGAT